MIILRYVTLKVATWQPCCTCFVCLIAQLFCLAGNCSIKICHLSTADHLLRLSLSSAIPAHRKMQPKQMPPGNSGLPDEPVPELSNFA